MRYLVAFVPDAAAEGLLEALFAAGAGALGNYDRSAFAVRGQGRFRPLAGSAPAIGEPPREGEAAAADVFVAETRIELLVPDDRVEAVTAALRAAHPYETPAFYVMDVSV
jgi:hypothetical protein